MKPLIFSLAIVLMWSCKEMSDKKPYYEYNVQAIITEKFRDQQCHFVCLPISAETIQLTFDVNFISEESYYSKNVGDTVFFEFISKHRFKK